MLIAVTGAAGRLGRYVVDRAVRAGHEVIASDLPVPAPGPGAPEVPVSRPDRVEWRGADLTDLDAAREVLAGAQGVIHLGALTHPRFPEPVVHHTNVTGSYNVFVAAEEHDVGAVCFASSVNAIGGVFSEHLSFDYFPVDEDHPAYPEDSYSQSKWIAEQQSAAFARRRPHVPFSGLRFPALRPDAESARRVDDEGASKNLWAWVTFEAAASACLLALHRETPGHAAYFVVADRSSNTEPTSDLAARWYPGVPLRTPVPDNAPLYSPARAAKDLNWNPSLDNPDITPAEQPRQP